MQYHRMVEVVELGVHAHFLKVADRLSLVVDCTT